MATSSKVHLDASQQPEVYAKGITGDSAEKTSQLLQENHDKHHIFFNFRGFHNHIVHHLLTIFSLGASPSEIERGYANNVSYQRPPVPLERSVVEDMHNPERYKTYLGDEKYYHDYLVFFKDEINKKGWENVINEYVFAGDERADDMLVRLFAGLLHPILHLGFGVEFKQPSIIAEALAQAAVHDSWMAPVFHEPEKAAKTNSSAKTLVQLIEDIKADKKLPEAIILTDVFQIEDQILKRAPEMIKHASQYTVKPHEVDEKTAEMINASAYFTSAAQKPQHQVKFDFFYIHSINCSIFFSTFSKAPWLSDANKCRLLEWKVRSDLAWYTLCGRPDLLLSEITDYKPKQNSNWDALYKRANKFPDDGHVSKLIRALKNGEVACGKFEGKDGFVLKGDMWVKIGNMAMDSVEKGEPQWVRGCGLEEAWKNVPGREQARL